MKYWKKSLFFYQRNESKGKNDQTKQNEKKYGQKFA